MSPTMLILKSQNDCAKAEENVRLKTLECAFFGTQRSCSIRNSEAEKFLESFPWMFAPVSEKTTS